MMEAEVQKMLICFVAFGLIPAALYYYSVLKSQSDAADVGLYKLATT